METRTLYGTDLARFQSLGTVGLIHVSEYGPRRNCSGSGCTGSSGAHPHLTIENLGDLDTFVTKLDFDAQRATDGLDIFAQRVDLSAVDVTVLDP